MRMSSGRLHSVLFCDRSAAASAVSSMVLCRRYSSVPRGGSAFSLAPPLSVFNFFLRHHYAPRRGYAAASSSSSAEKSALSFFSSKSTCRAVGIVGMPNVGKSTLFNALTSSQAAKAANFPFCTIDPNIGKIWVPDERLEKLAQLARSEKITPAQMEFVDIAGLVAGASQGAGLGNKFLANIREVSMILQVVRCFENGGMGEEIAHVEGTIDPIRDIETINTELQLADIETLQKALSKKTKANDEAGKKRLELIEKTLDILDKGQNAYTITLTEDEWPIFSAFHLLTAKPVLYCCNVREEEAADGNNMVNHLKQYVASKQDGHAENVVIASAKLESEVANLEDESARAEFLSMYGLTETGLPKVIRAARRMLKQNTYFTVGPQEARSWNVPAGATAVEAAAVIHTDFAKGFIKAETISYDDYIKYGGEKGAKDNAKLRFEGASYIVQDGDVLFFRFRK